MPEPTIQEIFGIDATQDGNQLVISKANLAEKGLTVADENSAESMFTAMILLAKDYLNELTKENDPDIQVQIEKEQDSLIRRDDKQYLISTFTISLEKEQEESTIDPDDY